VDRKILYALAVLALGLAIAALIAVNKPEINPEPYEPIIPTVRVIRAAAAAEYLSVSSQGTVQPRSQSELIPEVSGRVTWISPSLVNGGAFREGDTLLRIDDADYRTLLERNEADLKRAEVEFTLSQDELKRVDSLNRRQLASQQQLDTARRAARVDEATLAEARADLEQARRDLSRTELKAPFDGLVRSEQVDLGQFVTRGQSIGTIYATDYVEVRLPISADQLQYLGLPISTRGQIPPAVRPPVTVAADFGDTRLLWEGQLVRRAIAYGVRGGAPPDRRQRGQPYITRGAFRTGRHTGTKG
jgi:multidrug efflux pump subunit AcrA (membrane-fusion protein)